MANDDASYSALKKKEKHAKLKNGIPVIQLIFIPLSKSQKRCFCKDMNDPPKENNRSNLGRPLLLNAGKYLAFVSILGGPRRIAKFSTDGENPDSGNPSTTARAEKSLPSSRKRSFPIYTNNEGYVPNIQQSNQAAVDFGNAISSTAIQKKFVSTEPNKYERELKRLSSSSAKSSCSSDRPSGVLPQSKELQLNQTDPSRNSIEAKLPKNLQEVVYVRSILLFYWHCVFSVMDR